MISKKNSGKASNGPDINEKLKRAKKIFIETDLKQKEICSVVGISAGTFKKYKDLQGWEEQKTAFQVTVPNMVNQLQRLLSRLLTRLHENPESFSPKDADSINKLSATIKNLEDGLSLDMVLTVITPFGNWVCQKDKKLGLEILDLMDEYMNEHYPQYAK